MELHSVQDQTIQAQIDKLKSVQVKPRETKDAFVDPIKEFTRASRVESMVRNWLTYPVEERKRLIRNGFRFIPKMAGDPATGVAPETQDAYETRQLERWRALCVIVQEESRSRKEGETYVKGSVEVAIGALKQLFPEHDWKATSPPEK